MKQITLICSLLLFFIFFGCSESSNERVNQESGREESSDDDVVKEDGNKEGGDSYDDFTESMKNFEEIMKGEGKVEAVDFRKLKEFLPEEIEGLNKTSATGEKTNSFGIKVSETRGKYKSEEDNQQITIIITDLGSIKGVAGMAAFAWAYAEVDKETDTGYERTTKYSGFKAFEKYDTEFNNGRIEVLVADRFMVKAEGDNVPMETIKSAIDEIDLNGLEDMKDEGKGK